MKALRPLFPSVFTTTGDVQIGPIPKGTAINLLGNFDPLPEDPGVVAGLSRAWSLTGLIRRLRHDLAALPESADDETARRIFTPLGQELYRLGTALF